MNYLERNIKLFGLNVKNIIGEEIVYKYGDIYLYTNSKYKLPEIDIIFDSIQELKEYLSFPYKVENYKGFDIYRGLIYEDDEKVEYYFKYEIKDYEIITITSSNISDVKINIDDCLEIKNKYSLGNSKEIKFTTKCSVKINSENGITTVIISE